MTKYRPYSRRVFRQRLRAWLTAYVREISMGVLVVLGLLAIEVFLLVGIGDPRWLNWLILGAISSLLVCTLLAGLGLSFLVGDRTAIHQLRGAWGEENTRDVLKSAKRKGHVWGWVDSVSLAAGDIDHIVVSRQGGLVAIDSKWRSRVDHAGRDAMVRDAMDSRRRAEGVVRTVLSRERAGKRADGKSLRVRPVVVLWGSAQTHLPNNTVVDGVSFVRGRDLVRWLEGLDGEVVDKVAAEQLLANLAEYRAKTWKESVSDPR